MPVTPPVLNGLNLWRSVFGMVSRKRSAQFADKPLPKGGIGDVPVIASFDNLNHSVTAKFIKRLFE